MATRRVGDLKVRTQGSIKMDEYCSVGIDQSYTGFAVTFLNDTGYLSHVLETRPTANPVERLVSIRDWLLDLLHSPDIPRWDCLAMEGYGYASQSGFMLGELGGMIKLLLWDCFDAFPLVVAPNQLKKYATGKGQAKKQEILLAVYKQWGVEFKDDNMADSYVLARIAGGHAETVHQKLVVDAVKTSAIS